MSYTQAVPVADSVRAVLDSVYADPKYVWERAPNLAAWLRNLWEGLGLWLEALHAEHPLAYWALIVALTVLLAAILTHFGVLAFQALRPQQPGARREAVMVAPPRDAAWYRARALELERDGRLLESLVHRFVALVLQLERLGVLRVHPAKTAAEYLGEAKMDADGRATFGRLVRQYYDHVFGGVPVDRATLERFDRQMSHLTAHGESG